MEKTYTKNDFEKMEDRYENFFSLPYETEELPDMLVEIKNASYQEIRSKLINNNFSLIVCVPRLPVFKVLKKAELLAEKDSFRLLRISPENYDAKIEEFLQEMEYALSFFWIADCQTVVYELPKTSQERIRLSGLTKNRLYSFWMEVEECTMAVWEGNYGS